MTVSKPIQRDCRRRAMPSASFPCSVARLSCHDCNSDRGAGGQRVGGHAQATNAGKAQGALGLTAHTPPTHLTYGGMVRLCSGPPRRADSSLCGFPPICGRFDLRSAPHSADKRSYRIDRTGFGQGGRHHETDEAGEREVQKPGPSSIERAYTVTIGE